MPLKSEHLNLQFIIYLSKHFCKLGYPQGSNADFDSKRQSRVAQIKSKLQGVKRDLQKISYYSVVLLTHLLAVPYH
jgi:hypothetical protein